MGSKIDKRVAAKLAEQRKQSLLHAEMQVRFGDGKGGYEVVDRPQTPEQVEQQTKRARLRNALRYGLRHS